MRPKSDKLIEMYALPYSEECALRDAEAKRNEIIYAPHKFNKSVAWGLAKFLVMMMLFILIVWMALGGVK